MFSFLSLILCVGCGSTEKDDTASTEDTAAAEDTGSAEDTGGEETNPGTGEDTGSGEGTGEDAVVRALIVRSCIHWIASLITLQKEKAILTKYEVEHKT